MQKQEPLRNKVIGVVGGRDAGADLLRIATEVGREIARAGAILICGGLGGVMEAASKGAYEEGGTTVGVLPTEEKTAANPYIKVPIATGLGIGRNVIISRTADALVAVGGGYGTLSEIAFALQLGKPVVGIRSWDVEGMLKAGNAREAVKKVLQLLSIQDL